MSDIVIGITEADIVSPEYNEFTADSNVEVVDEIEEDSGLLDYIASIEENMDSMNMEIGQISLDLDEMAESVDMATIEITKANTSGGSGTATSIRNIARKLAKPIDDFSTKLKAHIRIISEQWAITENSYLALLDNKHILSAENITGLKGSITSLKDAQNAISTSNKQVENFQSSLQTCKGMERRLNRALNTLTDDLQSYLSMTDMMFSSIDRIEMKSQIVIDN